MADARAPAIADLTDGHQRAHRQDAVALDGNERRASGTVSVQGRACSGKSGPRIAPPIRRILRSKYVMERTGGDKPAPVQVWIDGQKRQNGGIQRTRMGVAMVLPFHGLRGHDAGPTAG